MSTARRATDGLADAIARRVFRPNIQNFGPSAGEGFGQETPAECADVPIQVSLEPAPTRHVWR